MNSFSKTQKNINLKQIFWSKTEMELNGIGKFEQKIPCSTEEGYWKGLSCRAAKRKEEKESQKRKEEEEEEFLDLLDQIH